MKRKAITVIMVGMMSVFLMFSVGCGGSSNSDGSSPAGISGSAN